MFCLKSLSVACGSCNKQPFFTQTVFTDRSLSLSLSVTTLVLHILQSNFNPQRVVLNLFEYLEMQLTVHEASALI